MLIQLLLDVLRDLIVSWLAAFPGLPSAIYEAQAWLVSGGSWLNSQVSIYGAVIPFNTINALFVWWLGILAFWVVCLGIKVVLWSIAR